MDVVCKGTVKAPVKVPGTVTLSHLLSHFPEKYDVDIPEHPIDVEDANVYHNYSDRKGE